MQFNYPFGARFWIHDRSIIWCLSSPFADFFNYRVEIVFCEFLQAFGEILFNSGVKYAVDQYKAFVHPIKWMADFVNQVVQLSGSEMTAALILPSPITHIISS